MGFSGEVTVKAVRKRHICDGCREHIDIGNPAVCWVGMSDDESASFTYHPDCREAEIKLNDTHGWRYGDEWMGLADYEHDDMPWLIETYPAVAVRMGLAPAPQPKDQTNDPIPR